MAERQESASGIVSLRLMPDQVVLEGAGAGQRVLVLATGGDGLEREVTAQASLSISRPEVASLGPEGKLVSISDGEAHSQGIAGRPERPGHGPHQPLRKQGTGQLRHRHRQNTDQAGLQWQQLSRRREGPGRI